MLESGRPKKARLCSSITFTWSNISSGRRLRIRFKRAVAQNEQLRLHPTWLDTQAVVRVSVGINTDSTSKPSCRRTAFLMVPSLLRCITSTLMWLILKCSASISRVAFGSEVIASKVCTPFCHNHSYTWLPRKALSPLLSKKVRSSSLVRARMSRFCIII